MNNYRLTLSYDGTKYNGWQRLSNTENTIQHKVETTLSRLLEQKIEVSSSGVGRTPPLSSAGYRSIRSYSRLSPVSCQVELHGKNLSVPDLEFRNTKCF